MIFMISVCLKELMQTCSVSLRSHVVCRLLTQIQNHCPENHSQIANRTSVSLPQNDWTTGVPDNGNEWRKFRVIPRLHPFCVHLFCTSSNRCGSRRVFKPSWGDGNNIVESKHACETWKSFGDPEQSLHLGVSPRDLEKENYA